MTNLSAKSFAQSAPKKNDVCIEREVIESYKNRCELNAAKLKETDLALQKALSDPTGLSFYQEKKFVGGLAVVTLLLATLLAAEAK